MHTQLSQGPCQSFYDVFLVFAFSTAREFQVRGVARMAWSRAGAKGLQGSQERPLAGGSAWGAQAEFPRNPGLGGSAASPKSWVCHVSPVCLGLGRGVKPRAPLEPQQLNAGWGVRRRRRGPGGPAAWSRLPPRSARRIRADSEPGPRRLEGSSRPGAAVTAALVSGHELSLRVRTSRLSAGPAGGGGAPQGRATS